VIVHACLSTPRFDFEAYGESADEAGRALIQALRIHGRQYELPKSWYFDLLRDSAVVAIEVGVPYRDGAAMQGGAVRLCGRVLRSGRVVWEGGVS
jgi:hypothetical protein